MACPICGANCKCKKRGPSGLCCDCHRHKPNAGRVSAFQYPASDMPPEVSASLAKPKEWVLDPENVKAWGEAMSKKKDLRNGKESGNWRPHKWGTLRAHRSRTDALAVAYNELASECGPFVASRIIAEISTEIDAVISKERLNAAGVQTLGA